MNIGGSNYTESIVFEIGQVLAQNSQIDYQCSHNSKYTDGVARAVKVIFLN